MVIPTSGPEQGARQRVGKFLPDGTVEFPLPYQIPGRSFGSTALPCNALGKKGLTSAQIRDVTLELKISAYFLRSLFLLLIRHQL